MDSQNDADYTKMDNFDTVCEEMNSGDYNFPYNKKKRIKRIILFLIIFLVIIIIGIAIFFFY